MRIVIDPAGAGTRLDKLLVDKVPGLGRAGAKRLFAEGRVRVHWAEGKWRKGAKGDVAVVGETIELEVDAAATEAATPDLATALTVLLETQTVLVLEKPAGQPTAPLAPGELGTLANAIVARYPELAGLGFSPREPGLLHRLDTETSGIVVAARTAEAFETLSRALKEERLDKRYLLVCSSVDLPESGTIEFPLAPHPKDKRRVYACVHPRDVVRYAPRPATTTYRVLRIEGTLALVEARAPRASRHQIRAHFAAIDHPLVGDALYGGPEQPGLARHALHAYYVAWNGDKTVQAFTVCSPMPADMVAIVGEAPTVDP
jgi:23S rRNA pseudouridine1911/1915/1917 synthase